MDIKWKDGDFVLDGNNAYIIEDSIIQELTFRLDTYKGSHWYYPEYGVKLEDGIGMANNDQALYFVLAEIDDALNQDDRVPDRSTEVTLTQTSSRIDATVDVAGREYQRSVRLE